MRRFAASLAVAGVLLTTTIASASEGKVCKVLPEFLDKKGRETLAPSLYERDAYQAYLRKHPLDRTALHVVVEYRAKGLEWEKAKLRAELRGLVNNAMTNVTLELPVARSGFWGNWAAFDISGDDYKKFGELVAWRVSLWEGERQLSEIRSYLWSGVPTQAAVK